MFNCPFCYPDVEASLELLAEDHPEFVSVNLANDGTKKWFSCKQCGGVFCLDRLSKRWQLSPKTYDRFVRDGLIKNKLSDDA